MPDGTAARDAQFDLNAKALLVHERLQDLTGVDWVTLDNPDRLNAVSRAMSSSSSWVRSSANTGIKRLPPRTRALLISASSRVRRQAWVRRSRPRVAASSATIESVVFAAGS